MRPRVTHSKLIKIQAQNLRPHPTAQREMLPSKLKQLTAEMDLDAIGVLHAVEYSINGEKAIWIIDGQHRWQVLMDLGFGEWEVEVRIHLDIKDDASAADKFLKLNNRAPVQPFDKFHKAYLAGHDFAVGITALAAARHLQIERHGTDGNLRCVSAIQSLFKIDEGHTLSLTLDTVIEAWGRTSAALEGKLLEGLGLLYKNYNGQIERPALVKKLAKYPGGASGLLGDARGLRQYRHSSVSRCVAERVLELYNAGRKKRLDPF